MNHKPTTLESAIRARMAASGVEDAKHATFDEMIAWLDDCTDARSDSNARAAAELEAESQQDEKDTFGNAFLGCGFFVFEMCMCGFVFWAVAFMFRC